MTHHTGAWVGLLGLAVVALLIVAYIRDRG